MAWCSKSALKELDVIDLYQTRPSFIFEFKQHSQDCTITVLSVCIGNIGDEETINVSIESIATIRIAEANN